MLVQEEGRLNKMRDHSLHVTFHDGLVVVKLSHVKRIRRIKLH